MKSLLTYRVIQIKYGLPYCVTCPSMSTDPGYASYPGGGIPGSVRIRGRWHSFGKTYLICIIAQVLENCFHTPYWHSVSEGGSVSSSWKWWPVIMSPAHNPLLLQLPILLHSMTLADIYIYIWIGDKNWIQQVLVGLSSSFPINYTGYHYTAVGKCCTLCVQTVEWCQKSWFTNPDRHCGRHVIDRQNSGWPRLLLQALWAQTWLDSARRPCQCSANENMQVTLKRSAIGHTRYIAGHASSFPKLKLCILFLCNGSMPTEPSNHHPIGWSVVMLLARVAENSTMETRFVYFFIVIVKWTLHSACFTSTAMIQIYILEARLMSFKKMKHISMSYFELFSN